MKIFVFDMVKEVVTSILTRNGYVVDYINLCADNSGKESSHIEIRFRRK